MQLPRAIARAVTLAVLALAPLAGLGNAPRADAQLKRVLESVGQGRLDTALAQTDQIIARHPNFRLAHLVRGDLLLARVQPIARLGNTGHVANDRLDELRAEALARLRAVSEAPPADRVPRALVQFEPRQTHAIVVDASRSRVFVFENSNGTPRLVEHYYTTIGAFGMGKEREGDRKTPVGVYQVTSRIPGNKLPDLYGWGAFPIDYPNDWDRLHGRTGYGIWLHGVPSDTYARAPRASDGCIALSNSDIEDLATRVQPGATPVIIADRVEWVSPDAQRAEREVFARQLEAWLADWQSLDSARYLAHYSRTFRSGAMDLEAWQSHKRRVNAAKSWLKVSLSSLSVFRHPGTPGLVAVTFEQDYRSSNLSQKTRKRQYWVEEDGRWRIAYEAPVGAIAVAMPESFARARR